MRAPLLTLAALSVSALAGATDIAADVWTNSTTTDRVESTAQARTTLGDTEGKRAIIVNCGEGVVMVYVDGKLDVEPNGRATLEVRFESDLATRDLDVYVVGDAADIAVVDDPSFLLSLEEHDGEALHVQAPVLGVERSFTFHTAGAEAALEECWVGLAAVPASEVEENQERDAEANAGVVGAVVTGVKMGEHPDWGRASAHPIRVRSRVQPRYPDGVDASGPATCHARVEIDAQGIPTDVQVEACPSDFHEATKETLMQWRWYPVVVDGEAIPFYARVAVKFLP